MKLIHCRYGDFFIPDFNDLIFNSMREYGEWAQEEIEMLGNFICAGDTVLDIGAFIGTHSRAFSVLVGEKGSVHAFEPNQLSFSCLQKNSQLAHHSNLKTYPIALGGRRHSRFLVQGSELENLGSSRLSDDSCSSVSLSHEIIPLDDLNFSHIDFIKIDVEGMEFDVLSGGLKTIQRYKPIIFLEVNSLQNSSCIIDFSNDINYSVFGNFNYAFNAENFNHSVKNMFGQAAECGLILIHRDSLNIYSKKILSLHLIEINTIDDLALLLLNKPQYIHDFLKNNDVDYQICGFTKSLSDRDNRIAELSHALNERDERIACLEDQINLFFLSRSWRFTKPIRWFNIFLCSFLSHVSNSLSRWWSISKKGIAFFTEIEIQLRKDNGGPVMPTHPVSVIIPVYRGVEITRRCIEAAMGGVMSGDDAKLLVINDASPENDMGNMLKSLKSRWPKHIDVLQNEKNLGFVHTVNRGIAAIPSRDVVLLNSDVIVPRDWLARIRVEAYSRPCVGTVTPMSNNATICGFPYFLQENSSPYEMETDQIDLVFKKNLMPCIEAPTGVGFCMYVRRSCLDDIGVFDAERFGRGYGEENDFCQRALKAGWVNLITPNIYAFHEGGVSFCSEKHELVKSALRVIDKLHPQYHADVASFCHVDPLRGARITRHLQLLPNVPRPKVLYISHRLGGGTRQHLDELISYHNDALCGLLLIPSEDGGFELQIGFHSCADILRFREENYIDLLDIIRSAGVSCIHFHHTIGFPDRVLRLPDDLGVHWIITVHDYYWLSANPTLTDSDGNFQSQYDQIVNPLYQLPAGLTPELWRDNFRTWIECASCVIFPSTAIKLLFDENYHIKRPVIASHLEVERNIYAPLRHWHHQKQVVIGVLGALGKEKGADFLEELASLSRQLKKPYSFRLLGYAYRPLRDVIATGAYLPNELQDLINKENCGLIFFPARWPETYSYTLSYAMESGLPIIAPNLGAFPERLSSRLNTLIYEVNRNAKDLLILIDEFISSLVAGQPKSAPVWNGDLVQKKFYEDEYLNMVRSQEHSTLIVEAESLKSLPGYLLQSHAGRRSWRENAVHFLWLGYMHPYLHWFGRRIPRNLRRVIRRGLSKLPLGEILQRYKREKQL